MPRTIKSWIDSDVSNPEIKRRIKINAKAEVMEWPSNEFAAAIRRLFVWADSPEGQDYWLLVSKKKFEEAEQLLKSKTESNGNPV